MLLEVAKAKVLKNRASQVDVIECIEKIDQTKQAGKLINELLLRQSEQA